MYVVVVAIRPLLSEPFGSAARGTSFPSVNYVLYAHFSFLSIVIFIFADFVKPQVDRLAGIKRLFKSEFLTSKGSLKSQRNRNVEKNFF